MGVALDDRDRALLAGEAGDGARLAMKIIVRMAEVGGARRLRDITAAHIDGCLDHGRAGLDFVERLAAGGARVRVPTTLNVGSLDLLHPELFRGDRATAEQARRLMDAYVGLGCEPTWTCAPYQLPRRPAFGEHVAWAESNAIVFANSVLGARTDRYGDFMDICAAVTGRVPDAGLHLDANRRGRVVFRLEGVAPRLLEEDAFYPVLGHLVGRLTGSQIPVIVGLPLVPPLRRASRGDSVPGGGGLGGVSPSGGGRAAADAAPGGDRPDPGGLPGIVEDRLKALGAAAASSGSVALFHAVGVTPEAPTLSDALQGHEPDRVVAVTPAMLGEARDSLTTAAGGPLAAVSVGTPHFSIREFAALVPLLEGARIHPDVDFYVNTSRHVLGEVERRGWLPVLDAAGVTIVTDTCTYITPIMRERRGIMMTNSAKWAYYAPGNLGVEVAFGSLE
ncbi:MAG TPA: aconitase X catalytic domain-containing protein, partial [Bacillota bacterium]